MGKNIKILFVISLVVALVCYTYYLNPQNVAVTTSPGKVIELPLAILMLALVLAGAIISALISLLVTTKMKFKIWGLEKNLEKISLAEANVKRARGYIALEMYEEAIALLKKVSSNHQFQHSAKALLITTLAKLNRNSEALLLISSSRIEDADTELLILCAGINAKENNYTAAFDNLSLVLKKEPQNEKALSMMVTAADKLSLIEESISFQEQLVKLKKSAERNKEQLQLAKLELKKGIKDSSNDNELLKEIERILQRHRDFPAALAKRSEIFCKNGDVSSASKDLSRAYEVSGDVQHMISLVSLWLKEEKPSEALNRIEHFTSSKDSIEKHPQLQLLLGQLLLHLEMVDMAKKLIGNLRADDKFSRSYNEELLILENLVSQRVGKFDRAVRQLSSLSNLPTLPGRSIFEKNNSEGQMETISEKSRSNPQTAYTPA